MSTLPVPHRSSRVQAVRLWQVVVPLMMALVLVLALAPVLKAAPSHPEAQAVVGTAGQAEARPEHVHGITLGELAAAQRAARLRGESLPTPAPAAISPAEPMADGGWQAQFGAFAAAAAAERQRGRILASGAAHAGELTVERAGAVYRLTSTIRTRGAAAQLCSRAGARGLDCFVRGVSR